MNFECENCGHQPAGKHCPACKEKVPAWAKFCPGCGQEFRARPAGGEAADPFAMENRRSCPDGNCIGILDAEGRCVVCGIAE